MAELFVYNQNVKKMIKYEYNKDEDEKMATAEIGKQIASLYQQTKLKKLEQQA